MKISESYQSPVKKSAKKVKGSIKKDKENSAAMCEPWKYSGNKNYKSSKPFVESTSKKSALENIDIYKHIPLTPNHGCKYSHTNEREKNLSDQIKQMKKHMQYKENEFSKDKALWV